VCDPTLHLFSVGNTALRHYQHLRLCEGFKQEKMHWIEATRGDGTSTGALEFEVSVETQIW
jgi:hypothetical protein